jgi:hypothetical protein
LLRGGRGGGRIMQKAKLREKKIISIAFVMGSIPINENGYLNTPLP